MILFVAFANVLVAQYGRGVVRGALDEGVRAASIAGAEAEHCRETIRVFLGDLLGGPMGDGVEADCWIDSDRVHATAEVTFESWLPLTPDFHFTASATALKEHRP